MALERLDEDEKGVSSIYTPGGKQEMAIVNEPGLYALVLGSRKPEAKAFKRWITHEIIPAIRKHGGYLTQAKTDDERKALEDSILADGCRDALIVDETNTIIDGHNRYEICTKHGIPFNVVVRHFDSRDDKIVFICRNQIGRRNLSPDTLSYVIGLMYNLEKKKHGGDRGNKHTKLPTTQNEEMVKPATTATRIAKEIGVGRATVERAGQFASAVDALSKDEPSVKTAILSGKSGLTRKSVVEIAAMDDEKKKAAVDKIKAGEGMLL